MILNVSVLCAILFKSSLAEKYWKAMIVLVPLFFLKWANPGLFFIYFHLFKHTFQILQQIQMSKNVHPGYGAGI